MISNSEIIQQVYNACINLESQEENLGPELRKGVFVTSEFDCYNKCHWNKDTCAPGKGGFHGAGARRIGFYVSSPGRGGVCYALFTPIYTASVLERSPDLRSKYWILGSVDTHIANPTEKHKSYLTEISKINESEPCRITGVNACWCDSTSMQAEAGLKIFLESGTKGIWSWLAEQWFPEAVSMFGDDIYGTKL